MTNEIIIPSAIQEACEKNDIKVSVELQDSDYIFELEWMTSAGQDSIEYVWVKDPKDIEEFLSELHDVWYNYDPEEQADLWCDEDYEWDEDEGMDILVKHGKNGAPYIYEDIVEDMQEVKDTLNELYRDIQQAA